MLSITLFVNDGATASGNGLAWATAYDDLQSALTQAATLNTDGNTANDVDQIWIAEGTYHPTTQLEPGDARSASFSLVDSVTLYGGFAGTEITLAERNLFSHLTSLSGNFDTPGDNSDNAYTVVYCGEGIKASIDGLSITGGNATDPSCYPNTLPGRSGAGVYINGGTLTITNSDISGNYGVCGGGINNSGGNLTIHNSTLLRNGTTYGDGGAILNEDGVVSITNSTISSDYPPWFGPV